MHPTRTLVRLIILVLGCLWLAVPSQAAEKADKADKKAEPAKPGKDKPAAAKDKPDAPAKEPISGGIPMTFEKCPRLLTASRVVVKPQPDVLVQNNDEGTVKVAGSDLKLAVRKVSQGFVMALDCNGDEQFSPGEAVTFDPKIGQATFDVKVGTVRTAVTLYDIRVAVDQKSKAVTGITARVTPAGCMKGTYGGVAIRLIDDNLDGKFTQDGRDAVAFGNSIVGVPLLKTHAITDKHFEFEVAEDGSKLGIKPLSDAVLAQVRTPFTGNSLKCLVIASKSGSYDISGGNVSVPEGEYRMAFGALAGEGKTYFTYPPVRRGVLLTYKLEGGQVNTLRIGPPFGTDFELGINAQNVLNVKPALRVFGSGGEEYGPVDFAAGTPPGVQVGTGERVLASGAFVKGAEFTCRVPANVENGWVKVGLKLPAFGLVIGTKDFDGKFIGKDLDAPAVANKTTAKAMEEKAAQEKAAKADKARKTDKSAKRDKAEKPDLLDTLGDLAKPEKDKLGAGKKGKIKE